MLPEIARQLDHPHAPRFTRRNFAQDTSESSRDPSSINTVSHVRSRPSSTGLRRAHSDGKFADSLNTGTTIDTKPRSARDMPKCLELVIFCRGSSRTCAT